jgi:hypothetical protein
MDSLDGGGELSEMPVSPGDCDRVIRMENRVCRLWNGRSFFCARIGLDPRRGREEVGGREVDEDDSMLGEQSLGNKVFEYQVAIGRMQIRIEDGGNRAECDASAEDVIERGDTGRGERRSPGIDLFDAEAVCVPRWLRLGWRWRWKSVRKVVNSRRFVPSFEGHGTTCAVTDGPRRTHRVTANKKDAGFLTHVT